MDLAQVYERLLELPVPVVLTLLWVVGVVLEGSCVAALNWNGLVLAKLLGT